MVAEADYQRARYHFMRSDDMLGLGRMLVEVQVELGYRSEIDLFAVQAVLQLLCLRDQANASRFFTAYTEQHPLLETQVRPDFVDNLVKRLNSTVGQLMKRFPQSSIFPG